MARTPERTGLPQAVAHPEAAVLVARQALPAPSQVRSRWRDRTRQALHREDQSPQWSSKSVGGNQRISFVGWKPSEMYSGRPASEAWSTTRSAPRVTAQFI